jgi:hypothetical protein
MTPVLLLSPNGKQKVMVNVEGIEPLHYKQVSDALGVELERATQTYIATASINGSAITGTKT